MKPIARIDLIIINQNDITNTMLYMWKSASQPDGAVGTAQDRTWQRKLAPVFSTAQYPKILL